MSFSRFSSHLGKKGREQFSAEKNRKIYGGNRFRNIKNMAGTHFLIGIGNQIGKIGSKKGPEFGIPPEFPEFRSDFPTKCHPMWSNSSHLRIFLVRFYGLVKPYWFLRQKFAVGVFSRFVLCNMSIKLLYSKYKLVTQNTHSSLVELWGRNWY